MAGTDSNKPGSADRDMTRVFNGVAIGATGAAVLGIAGAAAFGPLGFAAPLMLGGLAGIPPLWWLMRSVPPKPRDVDFPAVRFLFDLQSKDQQPVRMPLWQRLLRASAYAAIVFGLAHPQWDHKAALEGKGPVMMVVDNGWASARSWPAHIKKMEEIIDRAGKEGRLIAVLTTAPDAENGKVTFSKTMNAEEARGYLKSLHPNPWPDDHKAALRTVGDEADFHPSSVFWFSDDLEDAETQSLAKKLQAKAPLTVFRDAAGQSAHLITPPQAGNDTLDAVVRRPDTSTEETLSVAVKDESGHLIDRTQLTFRKGDAQAKGHFDVSPRIRSSLVSMVIEGEQGAGAVALLDEHWRRRPVGIVDNRGDNLSGAALTSGSAYYIEHALGASQNADVRKGSLASLMEQKIAVLILPDDAVLTPEDRRQVEGWVRNGGMLLRFAGPHLAESNKGQKDSLLPVDLNPGSVSLSLLGEKTPGIKSFPDKSPLHGLKVPKDVTIKRDVMARPTPTLEDHTWASLEDGTPFITARSEGKGQVVLVHTSADPANRDWSDLALSGFFVDMLKALVASASGIGGAADEIAKPLPAVKIMDGQGQLKQPPPEAKPLDSESFRQMKIGAQTPPGFYGSESSRVAFNLAGAVPSLKRLGKLPEGVKVQSYASTRELELGGLALGGGLTLMLADLLILLGQRGLFSAVNRKRPEKSLDSGPNI